MLLPDDKHRLEFPGVSGLYGYVTVDGAPLEVYGVEHKDGKTVAYIEAREGKEFQTVVVEQRSNSKVTDDYAVRYLVDGQRITGDVWSHSSPRFPSSLTSSSRFRVFKGKRTSPTSRAPLRFNRLRLTDDEDGACRDEQTIKNLGTIQLVYWRVRNIRLKAESSRSGGAPVVQPIHEQAKKAAALSHRAEYGSSQPAATCKPVIYDLVDAREAPFATIEFRYLSRSLLRIQDLLPPPRSPEPAASPSPRHPLEPASPVAGPSQPRRPSAASPSPTLNLADDELQSELESLRRQERIAQLEREARRRSGAGGSEGGSSTPAQAQKKVKRETITLEDDDDDERERKRVKREEVDEIERKKEDDRRKGKKPEVIDLCDSD